MTLKELEAWHRREAEGSCVAPKQRIAVVRTMRSPLKVPKRAETERGGILQLRIFWRQSEGNDHASRQLEEAHRAV